MRGPNKCTEFTNTRQAPATILYFRPASNERANNEQFQNPYSNRTVAFDAALRTLNVAQLVALRHFYCLALWLYSHYNTMPVDSVPSVGSVKSKC